MIDGIVFCEEDSVGTTRADLHRISGEGMEKEGVPPTIDQFAPGIDRGMVSRKRTVMESIVPGEGRRDLPICPSGRLPQGFDVVAEDFHQNSQIRIDAALGLIESISKGTARPKH